MMGLLPHSVLARTVVLKPEGARGGASSAFPGAGNSALAHAEESGCCVDGRPNPEEQLKIAACWTELLHGCPEGTTGSCLLNTAARVEVSGAEADLAHR